MTVTRQKLVYHGTGGELFGLMFVNSLLTIVTAGIYSFWGRTKIRQYMYTQTEVADDRFAYHGTGAELFKGWLKAAGILFLLFVALGVAVAILAPEPDPAVPPGQQPVFFLIQMIYTVIIAVLVNIAINGARRYRLSRSSWRGIRLAYAGRWQEFLALNLKGGLLTSLTLTLYLPYFRNQSREFLTNNSRFGSLRFAYDGEGGALFPSYLTSLLLAIPTLGLSFVWYKAFEQRHFWNHTTLGPLRFQSSMTGGALLGLTLTNLLLVVLTFGIGLPWAATRATRFVCENVSIAGDIDWGTVEQQAQLASATGEGLAQGLDVDADLGIGM